MKRSSSSRKTTPAQAAAADEAIKVDPNQAILYYIKGQGLFRTPPSIPRPIASFCLRIALQPTRSILSWLPTGPYSAEVAGILQQAGEKVNSCFKASH